MYEHCYVNSGLAVVDARVQYSVVIMHSNSIACPLFRRISLRKLRAHTNTVTCDEYKSRGGVSEYQRNANFKELLRKKTSLNSSKLKVLFVRTLVDHARLQI